MAVTLGERQPLARLAAPADDGREIALTHRSLATLRALGAWERIDPTAVSSLRLARVLDGKSRFALAFDPREQDEERLGQLVPNYLVRRALIAATALIVRLFTDDRPAARIVRPLLLRAPTGSRRSAPACRAC